MRLLLHFVLDSDTSGFFPQLARWHNRSRYQVIFGTLRPMAPRLRTALDAHGVECFSVGCRSRRSYPLGLARLHQFLRKRRVDILHTHLFDPSVVGLAAGYLAGTPVRVLTRHHSDCHTRLDKRWHARMDRLCTALAHRAIAVSEYTATVMRDREGADPTRVETILNGVDFDRLRLSTPDAPHRIRRRFAPGGERLLVTVARLHPEKGHDYLFQALARLRGTVERPFQLLVVGTGPCEAEFRRRVVELGVADRVTFTGFRDDVPDLMAAADLLVLPSVEEAFGLVLAEALYLGTPVVATRVGGIPEVVQDGVDGVLVPPASPDALAAALGYLLRNDAARQRLAGAGRNKIRERFGFPQMVDRYEALYESLLDSEPEPGHARRLGHHPQL